MAHTYANLLSHVIFSTKDRAPLITAALHDDLLAYIGGIVRELRGVLRAANARPDHVHLLCSLPSALAAADALRVIKTNSSRWVHRSRNYRAFDWQTGYGAFSVSASLAPAVVRYIRDQERHHRKMTFQEEFVAILRKNGIEYDEHYILVMIPFAPSGARGMGLCANPTACAVGYDLAPAARAEPIVTSSSAGGTSFVLLCCRRAGQPAARSDW